METMTVGPSECIKTIELRPDEPVLIDKHRP